MLRIVFTGASGIPFSQLLRTLKNQKQKPKKDIDISEASYCPKKKPGQSWAHSGGKQNDEGV